MRQNICEGHMKRILTIALTLLIGTVSVFAQGNHYSRTSFDDLLAHVAENVQVEYESGGSTTPLSGPI